MSSPEENYRAMIENSLDIVTVVDGSGLIRYESPSVQTVLGYAPHEMTGNSAFSYMHPDDVERVFDAFMGAIHVPGAIASAEYRFRCKDDSWCILESRARNLLDDPAVRGVVVNSRDVTARREAEEALRASEENLRAITESAVDAIIIIDRKGVICDWNRGARGIFGYEKEEVLGESLERLMPDQYIEGHRHGIARYLDTQVAHIIGGTVEVHGLRKNRETFPLELALSTWTAAGTRYFTGIIRDITERRQAEEALRRSEAHYRALLHAIPDAMVRVARDGTYLGLKSPTDFGWFMDPDDLVGQSAYEVLPPGLVDKMMNATLTALDSGETQTIEYQVSAGGETRIREARVVACGEDEVMSIMRDITERKRAEDALLQSEALLRTVVTNIPVVLFALDGEGHVRLAEGKGLETIAASSSIQDASAAFAAYQNTMQQDIERALQGETFSVRTAFADRTFECWFSPLFEANGSIDGVIGVAADITEIEHSRTQLRELALHLQSVREEERTRISREVHDVLGQSLTALRMEVAWIEKRLLDEQASLHVHVEGMKEIIDETIGNVRRIASELRPGILDDLGLAAALEWQTQEFAQRTGVRFGFTGDADDLNLGRQRSTMVFRIFQEILTNIARHAQASRIDVTLLSDAETLVLEVQDNGRGIRDEDVANTTSLGLLGMRERAQAWGGAIHLSGASGVGTRVTLRLPL